MVEQTNPLVYPASNPPSKNGKEPLLLASAVSRVFRQGGQEVIAVFDASCQILPRDRIAITGPSGSGKSTLLHLFAGLDQPSSGMMTWPALGIPEKLRPTQIGVALQLPGLLPPLTVLENVSLPLILEGKGSDQATAAALIILQGLELDPLTDQLPEELSGGQAQRVALARALVTHPRLVLLDEPTGQLDHPTAQRLFDLLFAILADSETALVVATHDRSIAERLDEIWEIHQGALIKTTRSA